MRTVLPERGRSWPELREEMQALRGRDVDWRAGRASVYVFHSGDDALQVAHDAYGAFISENGLGPGAFPSLKRMESDVVDMGLALQHAPDGAAGSMTSGGTESILLAMKTCRDWSRRNHPVRGIPRVVAPRTAHPAFDKAAHYLGMQVVRVPVTSTEFVADLGAMAAAIDEDTVMLVGSAPCFPFGVTDPIEELGKLAEARNLWLHVDACVGGYVAPFVRMLGEQVPDYDFRVAGVTSLSADLHKYGYAAKGASTVFYRDKALKEFQGFHFDDWPSGHMYTPTLAGTRPGGAIAAAWAVMNYLGVAGYCERARAIVDTRRRVAEAVLDMGLRVLGDPRLSLITFGAVHLDILAVGDALLRAGWVSSRTNAPAGIHLMISPAHSKTIEEYLAVLRVLVEQARRGELGKGTTDIRYG
jgi:glutamate/tyrosine decarboxylase-like PLP-dependent enzyme